MPFIRVRLPRKSPVSPPRRGTARGNGNHSKGGGGGRNTELGALPRALTRTLALNDLESEFIWNECLLQRGEFYVGVLCF